MSLPEPREPGPVAPRAGYADRDATVELLQQAAAEGRLDDTELDERVSAALTARTLDELAALVADLPGGQQVFVAPRATGRPGYSPDDPLMLSPGGWETEKREGRWTIPPWIVIGGGFGDLRLDCRAAQPAEPVITVQIMSGMGNVLLIVPDGWGVNLDRLASGWGTRKSKVAAEPDFGKPLIRIEGSTGLSSLTVRYPAWWDRKIKD